MKVMCLNLEFKDLITSTKFSGKRKQGEKKWFDAQRTRALKDKTTWEKSSEALLHHCLFLPKFLVSIKLKEIQGQQRYTHFTRPKAGMGNSRKTRNENSNLFPSPPPTSTLTLKFSLDAQEGCIIAYFTGDRTYHYNSASVSLYQKWQTFFVTEKKQIKKPQKSFSSCFHSSSELEFLLMNH